MNDIFGIPTSGLMNGLVLVLVSCLAVVGIAAMRRPVIFRLGIRNIPRRKAQTTLIVAGLMLSTLIIAAALGTGDTLHHSLTKGSYETLGQVDQLVVPSGEYIAPNIDTNETFPDDLAITVTTALAGNPDVDGIVPLLDKRVSVVSQASHLSEPTMILTGVDPAGINGLGGLPGAEGGAIDLDALATGSVVISAKAAANLDAQIGDMLTVHINGTGHDLTVAAIAEDTYLSGYRRGREDYLEYPGMVMPLASVQELTGQPGLLSAIAVSGTGDERDGFARTDAIIEALREPLAGTGLGVDAIKRYSVDDGESIASMFTDIFLVLGLFSIFSGILLIVLIFTMLAAERRSEMGMARAVGTQRRQLLQQFVSEGAGYALLAGLVGSALGVAAAIGIAGAMMLVFGQYVEVEPHVEARSMIIAYCLGVVITFLTIVIASWRVSKVNIVAAIRDIPDLSRRGRTVRTLIWGLAMAAGGGLLAMSGMSEDNAFFFFLGASVLPFGIAQILRFFRAPSRIVFSLASLWLIVLWLIPERLGENIWGELDAGIEMFFLAGIFLVIGATVLTMQNADLLLRGVNHLGGLFKGALPAVRTSVAYPAAAEGRTGMTIAMFSLIIFSLVMMATMNANVGAGKNADAGWDVVATAPGDISPNQFTADLEAAGVDSGSFVALGAVTNPAIFSSEVRMAGSDGWKLWPVMGMDDAFLESSDLRFQQRAEGYATDADVIAAMRSQSDLVVVDSWVIPEGELDGSTDSQFRLEGVSTADGFEPIAIELAGPDGVVRPVTIIGIIDDELSTMHAVFANQDTVDGIYPEMYSTSFYVRIADRDDAALVARQIEAALQTSGVEAESVRALIRNAEREQAGFLYMIEGFMALGLLVGVAAVGVIAFRSVVERRQQIGVLRALGFPRGLVSLGFLIETAFVVGLGAITGTLLGVLLSRNLLTGDSVGSPVDAFTVPWALIAVILGATVLAAMGMTWLPARQAGRIAPAEALRYE